MPAQKRVYDNCKAFKILCLVGSAFRKIKEIYFSLFFQVSKPKVPQYYL